MDELRTSLDRIEEAVRAFRAAVEDRTAGGRPIWDDEVEGLWAEVELAELETNVAIRRSWRAPEKQ